MINYNLTICKNIYVLEKKKKFILFRSKKHVRKNKLILNIKTKNKIE